MKSLPVVYDGHVLGLAMTARAALIAVFRKRRGLDQRDVSITRSSEHGFLHWKVEAKKREVA